MDWLKLDAGIHGNAKIWRAATDAGLSVTTFIGHYTGLLCHLARQESPDGHLASIPDSLLEHSMMWDGQPGALARVVRDHFEESDGCLAGWTERNGSAMKEAKADRERKRLERLKHKREKEAQSANPPDVPPDVPPESLPHERTDVRTDARTDELLTTTTSPAPRKQRAPRAKDSEESWAWLEPVRETWNKHSLGTFKQGEAAKHCATLKREGFDLEEICRRLDWYHSNRGSAAVLSEAELEKRHFSPTFSDFFTRWAQFDPSSSGSSAAPVGWAASAAQEWARRVGMTSVFRIERDLRDFVELYSDPADAERALVAAIKVYEETCVRRSQSPAWPDFVRQIQGFVPQNLLAPARVA